MMHLLIALLCLGVPSATQSQAPDPRTQPASAVTEAIRLLEAKKYTEFLKTFARPGDVERLTATRSMDEIAAEFGERRAPDVLAALRAAATMKPVMNEDGTRADYRFEKPFGRERKITLVKIGDYWYLQ